MAKINRELLNLFGETGTPGDFGVIGSKAEGAAQTSKDLALIQSLASFKEGLRALTLSSGGSSVPYLQDSNSLYFLFCSFLKYILQQGVAEWHAGEKYYQGSILTYDNTIWRALKGDDVSEDNTGNTPADGSEWWYSPENELTRRINIYGSQLAGTSLRHYETQLEVGFTFSFPYGIEHRENLDFVYLTDSTGDQILKLHGSGLSYSAVFSSPNVDPRGVTVDDLADELFIATEGSERIWRIDPDTGGTIGFFNWVTSGITDIAYYHKEDILFQLSDLANIVYKTNKSNGSQISSFLSPLTGSTRGITYNRDSDELYLGSASDQGIYRVDPDTGAVIGQIDLVNRANDLWGLGYDKKRKCFYQVTNYTPPGDGFHRLVAPTV